jgi:hypothetical protein
MRKGDDQMSRYRVLNPLGQPATGSGPSALSDDAAVTRGQGGAPRLDVVDGKTIYLVDVGFGGGHEFLKEMQRWFSKNRPRVTTVLRRKKGNMFLDDPGLWTEIKAKGHAVVLGVGG